MRVEGSRDLVSRARQRPAQKFTGTRRLDWLVRKL
jgi:cold shock protein